MVPPDSHGRETMLVFLEAIWALTVVVYGVIGPGWIGYWFELVLPPVMLALSFVVFQNAPRPIRLIHHWLVSLALLAAAGGWLWMVILFPKEQSPVGAVLLLVLIGHVYVKLLLLFAIGGYCVRLRGAVGAWWKDGGARAQPSTSP